MPDLLVVGFQELIEQSFGEIVKGFFSKDKNNIVNKWCNCIVATLNTHKDQYAFYQYKLMSSCVIMLFCKRTMLSRIKELYLCEVSAAKSGFAQNKGSVAMRFKIDDTSFAFLNCHLKSGEGNVVKRVEMLQTILSSAFVEQKGMPGLDKHSIVMAFGDLNFRVQCDYQTAINAFQSNDYRFLLAHDELNYLW